MDEWHIYKDSRTDVVEAHQVAVTVTGALVLSMNSGEIVRIYAHGHWCECVNGKTVPQE